MPELPEVETTKISLSPLLGHRVNKVQVFQPKLRWQIPDDLSVLVDYTLQNVERRAKYLIVTFEPIISANNDNASRLPRQLIIHLGMSGSLQQYPLGTEKRKHDHLIITFDHDNKSIQLHYHDPRRFGAVLWHDDYHDKLLDHLGPEPLSANFNADYLYHYIQRNLNDLSQNGITDKDHQLLFDKPCNKKATKRPMTRAIKSIIMEQQVVVGVGNIYASESLYLAGIHPSTPAHQLSHQQILLLVEQIKTILKKAIELGGSTLRDFTVASGQTGYFQQTLNVYGKQGELCLHCMTELKNVKINNRASVYCPVCQPL